MSKEQPSAKVDDLESQNPSPNPNPGGQQSNVNTAQPGNQPYTMGGNTKDQNQTKDGNPPLMRQNINEDDLQSSPAKSNNDGKEGPEIANDNGTWCGLLKKEKKSDDAKKGKSGDQKKTPGKSDGKQAKPQWWAMDIGKPQDRKYDIEELLKPTDNDVYPLSFYYNKREKVYLKAYRFIALVICVFCMIPTDIYTSKYHGFRVGYFDNDEYTYTLPIDSLNGSLSFNLSNVNVYFIENSVGDQSSIKFDISVLYGVVPQQTNTSIFNIQCKDSTTWRCVMNIYFPTNPPPGIYMPSLFMNFTGGSPQLFIDDYQMNGQALNFGPNGTISIQGNLAYINLQDHILYNLTIDMDLAVIELHNVRAGLKFVNVSAGLYNEYLPYSYVNNEVFVYQSYGMICLYAPTVYQITQDDSCVAPGTTNGTYFLPTVKGSIDPNMTCSTYAYMSKQQGLNFTNYTGAVDSVINVTIADGPIQIRYLNTTPNALTALPYQNVNFLNSDIQAAIISQGILNATIVVIEAVTTDDVAVVYQTVGIDYARSWMYTNTLAYAQAQVWPLSWASGTLLRPTISYQKIFIADSQCPARGETLEFDSDLSAFYNFQLPTTQLSVLTIVNGYSEFYTVKQTATGGYTYSQIKFTDNPLVIAAFAVSALIAILGALLIALILVQVAKVMKKNYNEYVMAQKKLAFTKKQAFALINKVTPLTAATVDSSEMVQQYVEVRGIFETTFVPVPIGEKTDHLEFKFSFFQIPALYMDFMFRKRANSLREFLKQIPENQYLFSAKRMKQADKTSVSILKYDFEMRYQEFCLRFGYRELQIEKQKDIFKEFDLILDDDETKEIIAYVNIRFKTLKEWNQSKHDGEVKDHTKSSIEHFLASECMVSQFSSDSIQFKDMTAAYLTYCDDHNIPESDRQQIIGSDDVIKFGAKISKIKPPDQIIGVKKIQVRGEEHSYNCGLIRKDLNAGREISKICKIIQFVKIKVKTITANGGPVSSFTIVVIHFAMVICLPLCVSAVTFLALSEMTRLQGDPYATPVEFTDVAFANSLYPWWTRIPDLPVLEYVHVINAICYVFGFFELISFYFTGFDNQGKFPVTYTTPKKFLIYGFYSCLGVLFVIYASMIWLILVWAILGVILNPPKFLPYGTAVATFGGVAALKFSKLKEKYELIRNELEAQISLILNEIVADSIAAFDKLSKMGGSAMGKMGGGGGGAGGGGGGSQKSAGSLLKNDFQNFVMTNIGKAQGGADIQNSSFNSMQDLTKVASSVLRGLEPNIIEAVLAVVVDNKMSIQSSFKKLAVQFNMDPELLDCVVALALSQYNPDKFGVREPDGMVVVDTKRLFRRLFPNLNVEPMGNVFSVVAEGDSKFMIELMDKFNQTLEADKIEIYPELFNVLIHTLFKEKSDVRANLLSFQQKVCFPNINQLFEVLNEFQDGKIKKFTENLDNKINSGYAALQEEMQEEKKEKAGAQDSTKKDDAEQTKKEGIIEETKEADPNKKQAPKTGGEPNKVHEGDDDIDDPDEEDDDDGWFAKLSNVVQSIGAKAHEENEKKKADSNINDKANDLGFSYHFPVLSMMAFQQDSPTLSRLTIKKILEELQIIKKMDIQKLSNYAPHHEDQAALSQAQGMYLSLYEILRGGVIDIKKLCQSEMKENSIDFEMAENLHMVFHNSQQAYMAIINRLSCTKSKNLLYEFYQILNKKTNRALNLCELLEIDGTKSKTASHLIRLIYNVLKYEALLKKYKIKLIPSKKYNLREKQKLDLEEVLKAIKTSITYLMESEKLFVSTYEPLNHLGKKEKQPERKQSGDSDNEGKDSSGEAKAGGKDGAASSGDEGKGPAKQPEPQDSASVIEAAKKKQSIAMVTQIFTVGGGEKKDAASPKENYQIFLECVLADPSLKDFGANVIKEILRSFAIVYLRRDGFLEQNDIYYQKSLRVLSDTFEILSDKLELLIDLIVGHPLDIFKAAFKNPRYSVDPIIIETEFDTSRTKLLQHVLKTDKNHLLQLVTLWYDQHNNCTVGHNNLPGFLKAFNINKDFISILRLNASSQSDDRADFDQRELSTKIITYIEKGIKKLEPKKPKKDDEKVFEEDKKQEENKDISPLLTERANLLEQPKERVGEEETMLGVYSGDQLEQTNSLFISKGQGGKAENLLEAIPKQPLSKEQKASVLKLIKKLLNLKKGEYEGLYEFVREKTVEKDDKPVHYIQILKSLLEDSTYYSASTIINQIVKMSASVPLFQKELELEFWDGDQECTVSNQSLYVQFQMAINCFQLQSICKDPNIQEFQMNQTVKKVIGLAYGKENVQKIYPQDETDFSNIFQTLYDSDFFKEIAEKLFAKLPQGAAHNALQALSKQKCNAILGIFMGAALENSQMVRHNTLSLLLGHEVSLSQLNGLAAILQGDIDEEADIKKICNTMSMDDQLLLNTIELLRESNAKLPQNVHYFLKGASSDAAVTGRSMIYALRKDIVNIKPIAKKLGVEHRLLVPIFSAAVGNTFLLEEFYGEMTEQFGMQNQKSIRVSLELASGQTECIYSLAQKKNKIFNISDPKVIEACFYITYKGSNIFSSGHGMHPNKQVGQLNSRLSYISKVIKKAFKYSKEQSGKFQQSSSQVINSCWGDPGSLKKLYTQLQTIHGTIWNLGCESEDEDDELRHMDTQRSAAAPAKVDNSLKGKFARILITDEQRIKFLHKKLNSIVGAYDKINALCKIKKQEMSKCLKNELMPEYIKAFEDDKFNWSKTNPKYQTKLETYQVVPKDDKAIYDKLEKKYQIGFQIGCTFGLAMYKPFQQQFYYCITCNTKGDDFTLGICFMCKIFCHAGHETKLGNYGQATKMICDCGQGNMNRCSTLNDNCPIEERKGEKVCSVLRWKMKEVHVKVLAEIKKNKAAEAKAKAAIKEYSEEDEIKNLVDMYSNEQFFMDLSLATKIDYSQQEDELEEGKIKYCEEMDEHVAEIFVPDPKNGLLKVNDDLLNKNISLVENLILFANGRISNSFISFLAIKKNFSHHDYDNQKIYVYKEKSKDALTSTLSTYNAFNCFVSIAQGDFAKFQQFGEGFCDILGEIGTKEETAIDKVISLFRLSRGGKLSQHKDTVALLKRQNANQGDKAADEVKGKKVTLAEEEKKGVIKKGIEKGKQLVGMKKDDQKDEPQEEAKKLNGYEKLFFKLFGMHGKKVILCHKLLTLSKKEITSLFSIVDNNQKQTEPEELATQNLFNWIDKDLFQDILELDHQNKQWVKIIIRLSNEDLDAFDLIAAQRKLNPVKIGQYKCLMNKNQKDLIQLFENVKTYVPVEMNKILLNVWNFEIPSIIEFIQAWLEIDAKTFKSWTDVRGICDKIDENKYYDHQYMYLDNLYALMSGDTMKLDEKVYSVLTEIREFQPPLGQNKLYKFFDAFYHGNDYKNKKGEELKFDPKMDRLAAQIIATHGLIYSNLFEITYVGNYMGLGDEGQKPAEGQKEEEKKDGDVSPVSPAVEESKEKFIKEDQVLVEFEDNQVLDKKKDGGKPAFTWDDIFLSLVSLTNQQWSTEDLELILLRFKEFRDLSDDLKPQVFDMASSFMSATEGDMISFGQVIDECLQESDQSHIHSLIVTLMTGNSKYDELVQPDEDDHESLHTDASQVEDDKPVKQNTSIQNEYSKNPDLISKKVTKQDSISKINKSQYQKHKTMISHVQQHLNAKHCANYLKREAYRLFEKIYKLCFVNSDQDKQLQDEFLKFAMGQKIPLHFIMLMTADMMALQKIFDPVDEIQANLKKQDSGKFITEDKKSFISCFFDFLDPTSVSQTQNPLLAQILEQGKFTEDTDKQKIFRNPKNNKDIRLRVPKIKAKAFDYFAPFEMKVIPNDIDPKIIENLKLELEILDAEGQEYIELDLVALFQLMFTCFKADRKSVINFQNIFAGLYAQVPILQNIQNMNYKLLIDKKYELIENLPSVISIIQVLAFYEVLKNQGKKPVFDEAQVKLVQAVGRWIEGIMIILDKEDKYEIDFVQQTMQNMLQTSLDYYAAANLEQNCLATKKDNVTYMVDVIYGTTSLCKQDFDGIEKMALKIGGFPPIDKLDLFVKLTTKHKGMINGALSGAPDAAIVGKAEEEGGSGTTAAGGAPKDEAPLDDKKMFQIFGAKNQNQIGIEEFKNVCKSMKLKISESKILAIFSKSDSRHCGQLTLYDFKKAQVLLKIIVVEESIEALGISLPDLMTIFALSLFMLLLIFVFIFIGIEAFSPITSFSSVVNSSMVLSSGGAQADGEQKIQDSDKDKFKEILNKKLR